MLPIGMRQSLARLVRPQSRLFHDPADLLPDKPEERDGWRDLAIPVERMFSQLALPGDR